MSQDTVQPVPETPPTGETQPVSSPVQTPSVSPGEKVAKLKSALADNKAHINALTKEGQELSTEIQQLEMILKALDESVNTYTNSLPRMEKLKKDSDEYYTMKKNMIDAANKDQQEALDQAIKDSDDEIEAANKATLEAEAECEHCKSACEAAKKAHDAKNCDIEDLKNVVQHTENNLQQLESLKQLIEKEDENNNPAGMYVLIREYKKVLDQTNVMPDDTYRQHLYNEWDNINATHSQLKKTEKQLDSAMAKQAANQNKLDGLVANRRDAIMERMANT